MQNSKPGQRLGGFRQLNGASLKGAGLEWGQEGVGTEGRQDKGDVKDAKPSHLPGVIEQTPNTEVEVPAKTQPGQHWPVNGHYPMTQAEFTLAGRAVEMPKASSDTSPTPRAKEGPKEQPDHSAVHANVWGRPGR